MNRYLLIFVLPSLLLIGLDGCKKDKTTAPSLLIAGFTPQAGLSPQVVALYGTGFNPDPLKNDVVFGGGVPAEVLEATAGRLLVNLPIGARTGPITVTTGGNSTQTTSSFEVAVLVSGVNSQSTTWTAGQKYFLKDSVIFNGNAVLTIEPGTIILANKETHASLNIQDNAVLVARGSPSQPIVFTSNQAKFLRSPGDWRGVTIRNTSSVPSTMSYVRIEFAGYKNALNKNDRGAALTMVNRRYDNIADHLQASFSAGDGFSMTGTYTYPGSKPPALTYLVAFACAGHDFSFFNFGTSAFVSPGTTTALMQFALGLKDPYLADQAGSDGIFISGSPPNSAFGPINLYANVLCSNITLIGANGKARNVLTGTNPPDGAVNANAGRGIHVAPFGRINIFNSVVAGSYLAGVSFEGGESWASYENGSEGASVVRNLYFTGVPLTTTTQNASSGYLGGFLAKERILTTFPGFETVAGTPQLATFNLYNKTQFQLDFNATPAPKDDLSLGGLANYKVAATNPQPALRAGTPLLGGAVFEPGTKSADVFFIKDGTFIGAFGLGDDWTRPWCNYSPQLTDY